jgi:hypothetical protein
MSVGPQPGSPDLLIQATTTHGNRLALLALFERFVPRVKAYLMQLAPAAGSTKKQVLLQVWRNAAQHDPKRADAAARIFTIACNMRIDVAHRTRLAMPIPDKPALTPAADAILAAEDRGIRVDAALLSPPPHRHTDIETACVPQGAFSDETSEYPLDDTPFSGVGPETLITSCSGPRGSLAPARQATLCFICGGG